MPSGAPILFSWFSVTISPSLPSSTISATRIKCTNPECPFEFFRPFSCKGFYLCPSCSQKRTLLFAEYLDQQLLQHLPDARAHLVRRYGLHSSLGRRRGRSWRHFGCEGNGGRPDPVAHGLERPGWCACPQGWLQQYHLQHAPAVSAAPNDSPPPSVSSRESRSAWARLLAKVYEVDPCDAAAAVPR